jgi:hypothetical protein
LQELAGALKLVFERCGDDFARYLLDVVLPAAGLPPAIAQQFVAHVRGGLALAAEAMST